MTVVRWLILALILLTGVAGADNDEPGITPLSQTEEQRMIQLRMLEWAIVRVRHRLEDEKRNISRDGQTEQEMQMVDASVAAKNGHIAALREMQNAVATGAMITAAKTAVDKAARSVIVADEALAALRRRQRWEAHLSKLQADDSDSDRNGLLIESSAAVIAAWSAVVDAAENRMSLGQIAARKEQALDAERTMRNIEREVNAARRFEALVSRSREHPSDGLSDIVAELETLIKTLITVESEMANLDRKRSRLLERKVSLEAQFENRYRANQRHWTDDRATNPAQPTVVD